MFVPKYLKIIKLKAKIANELIIPREVKIKLFLIFEGLSKCCNIDKILIDSTGKTQGIPFSIIPPINAINKI